MDAIPSRHHPAAPAIITGLAVIILAGSYLVLADYLSWWPYQTSSEDYSTEVIYRNERYGFQVKLPDSWREFTVITGERDIYNIASGDISETALTVAIRHPLWTTSQPRQDIPVDIYTHEQWDKINNEQYSVSAAPIPPSELARNKDYVFALPARYNYAFPAGWEEVETIMRSSAISSF